MCVCEDEDKARKHGMLKGGGRRVAHTQAVMQRKHTLTRTLQQQQQKIAFGTSLRRIYLKNIAYSALPSASGRLRTTTTRRQKKKRKQHYDLSLSLSLSSFLCDLAICYAPFPRLSPLQQPLSPWRPLVKVSFFF